MNNITTEQIDEIVTKAFLNVNETLLQDFVDNYYLYKAALEGCLEYLKNNNYSDMIYFDFAVLKTVQDNCVNILRETLKELLCEEQVT